MDHELSVTVMVMVERVDLSPVTHTFRRDSFEVRPFKIIRTPCGRGAAAKRYTYRARFIGLDGMIDLIEQSLEGRETEENINRKRNPRFNPKKLNWDGNVALVNQ